MTPDTVRQLIESTQTAGGRAFKWKTVPQGAATSVWAGVVAEADLIAGKFCEDRHVAEINESEELSFGVRRYALDPDRAKALWAKSEALVGERF